MCGLAGFIERGQGCGELASTVGRMAEAIHHRGPDDGGTWEDHDAGLALGHRRLSIQDLSLAGHQPMESHSGCYVVAFNGEIYNFWEIKEELDVKGGQLAAGRSKSPITNNQSPVWLGHSDTEVLLAAVEEWGIEKALGKFVGMFAFALWDKKERVLILARDRIGEKPLYYGWQGKSFVFGSELKALKVHPNWQGEINRDALALYMRHSYIPAPYSIYKGICKLIPGTFLKLAVGSSQLPVGEMPDPVPYWQAKDIAEYGTANPLLMSDNEAVDSLDQLLRGSIRNMMISDVSVGAFLSGGIDSSTVAALMQAETSQKVKTFSIGFHEEGYNEAEYARKVALHLGTEHTELYVTPRQTIDVIPKLPHLYDEPFSDSSQLPTFLVSEMTKKHVTVALSGDGGDEVFGGYNRYFLGNSLWSKLSKVPLPLRVIIAKCITSVSPSNWDRTGIDNFISHLQGRPGYKLHKLAGLLGVKSPEDLYMGFVSHWQNPSDLVLGASEPLSKLTDKQGWADVPEFVQRMMFLDTVSYLPDDILVKVDRAAMGVSLETRVPFIDHRVIEFAWQLPLGMKVRNAQGKWLLRQVLNRYVPKKLFDRPKMGFGLPLCEWLRGPLLDWAECLLDPVRLQNEGFLNPDMVRKKWLEHKSGRCNWEYFLWDIIMFQAWIERERRNENFDDM